MNSQPVLLVELDDERRKSLGFGLTAAGYEVVPAVDAAEGRRFASALDPSVIVAPVSVSWEGNRADWEENGKSPPTLLVLGEEAPPDGELPPGALFLSTRDLDPTQIVRRIRLALIGREIGVEPDYRLKALVGDFSMTPPLDLARRLNRLQLTARVECDDGAFFLREGEVIAARSGGATGVKGFCRLARRVDGPFRAVLGEEQAPPREIVEEFDALTGIAIDESMGEIPDSRMRCEVQLGPHFFSEPFTPLQQEILGVLHDGAPLGRLLDALPIPDGRIVREIVVLERRGVLVRRERQPSVAVVTDSTADLPEALVRAHGIEMVPLTVQFGDDRFLDRVELEPARFYELLASHPDHPFTEPPVPEKFAFEFHRRLRRQDLVAVLISEKLSQTVVHARQAAANPAMAEIARASGEPPRIEVVDSGQVSLPLGLLSLFAARMAERELSAPEIASRLRAMSRRVVTLFVVDTLEYLARGGRIGGARALLGRLMGIRPILGVEDGEVVSVDRVRGRRGMLPRLIELAAERLEPDRRLVVGVAHANAPARADRLRELVAERFEVEEIYISEMGPVVGTHVGPGCVGATFFQPLDDELELLAARDESSGVDTA